MNVPIVVEIESTIADVAKIMLKKNKQSLLQNMRK
jgi:hypothetical protein